jgi:hypothetical protein
LSFLRPAYATAHERQLDLWAGVIGWFGINAILLIGTLIGLLPAWVSVVELIGNVVLPVLFATTRRYVALGAVWAFACALLATVIDAPVGTVACLAFGSSSGITSAYVFGFLVGLIPGLFILRRVHRSLGARDGRA